MSGHGLLDLSGYEKFFEGALENYDLPDDVLQESLKSLQGFPKAPRNRTGKW